MSAIIENAPGDGVVLSPKELAEKLKSVLEKEGLLTPARTISVAKKKAWLADVTKNRAVFSLPLKEIEKTHARLVKSYEQAFVHILDSLHRRYVGYDGMTWDAYKTATIRAALSPNDEGEAKLRRDVKSFYARRNKGYFTGILNRELARTDKPFFHRWEIELLNAGEKMEKTNEMIGAVTDELRKAKQEMQDLANELVNIQEIVSVKLARQLDAIRNHRMASVRELQDILAPLKALRSFFDDGGERDAARLERLNALCSELERFHRSGALSGLVTALQVIRGTSDEG